MLTKEADKLDVIIYNSPHPPRIFKMSKTTLRTFLWILPVLLIILFFALFSFSYTVFLLKERPIIRNARPATMLENDSNDLKQRVHELEETNNELNRRLSDVHRPNQETTPPQTPPVTQPQVAQETDMPIVGLVASREMRNLTQGHMLKLEQLQFEYIQSKVIFKFNILNNATDLEKIQGYVHVVAVSESGLQYFPLHSIQEISQGVTFAQGESFSVARLRPVIAEFSRSPQMKDIKFIVTIFNRKGDLILQQESSGHTIKEL